MTYLLQVVVGFLMICMAFGPQSLWASFGPCVYVTDVVVMNTITCNNGVCTGEMVIVRPVAICKETAEDPCEQREVPRAIVYQPMAVSTHPTLELLINAGVASTCASCIVAATIGTDNPLAAASVCVDLCNELGSVIDPCWFNTCVQDPDTKQELPGGYSCL